MREPVEDNFEDLTVSWTENGVEVVRELDRYVVHKGSSWATIAFLFEERDSKTGEYRGPKINLRKYRKRGGRWQVNSKFVLGGEDQAKGLTRAVQKWFRPKRPQGRRPPKRG